MYRPNKNILVFKSVKTYVNSARYLRSCMSLEFRTALDLKNIQSLQSLTQYRFFFFPLVGV